MLLVITLIGFVGNAQIINIPDVNFKAKLLSADASNQVASTETPNLYGIVTSNNPIDTNSNGEIEVSEALAIKYINVNGSSIADLTGIEYFTNIEALFCNNNQLLSLDVNSLTNLHFLVCGQNLFTSLTISNLPLLWEVHCVEGQLITLNLSNLPNLNYLMCWSNQITSLDLHTFTNLLKVRCDGNQITTLNVSGLTNLTELNFTQNLVSSFDVNSLTNINRLECGYNQLTTLTVTGLTNLQTLFCYYNQLISLNLSGLTQLNILNCSNNALTSLDVSGCPYLNGLGCSYNQLQSITINGLFNLASLSCTNNHLAAIDLSGVPNLHTLHCWDNQLTSLNINSLPLLDDLYCYNNLLTSLFLKNGHFESSLGFSNNPNLEYICADEDQIAEIQATLISYGITNCHVNSYCSFTPGGTFYTIQGNTHYDSNNNGCTATDINYPSLKLAFTDGINTGNSIADTSGAYRYDVQEGTQTITPVLENASYFTVSPASAIVTFPDAASPFVQDFCLTANGTHNDLEVAIAPMGGARPGFDAQYKIIFKNKGTATQNGSVNLSFNDAVLDYVSALPAVTTQTTNNLSWNFSNLLPFEFRAITVTLNVNSPLETPPVNAGYVLTYTATVAGATDETPVDNTTTFNQVVVNSLDPNDKTCTEGTTITPAMVGKYVHYVIRFENDGTANAQNIVVKDMIDTSKFDISTLVPLSGSAAFTTRISNTNQVEFIFQNINLPYTSGTNTGYVVFKIKTKPTLVVGDTFTNSASIFFDYNAPIVTNTYTTTITALATQDFDFSSVYSLSPVPAKSNLTITSKQNVTISSVSIFNTLGQLVQVNTNPTETIDVTSLKTGTYFIKIISDKGTASSKFIKE